MPNFALGGMGSTIQNFQANQLANAIQRMKMQQEQQAFQQSQQTRQQIPVAFQQFSKLQGQGPSGIITPQQLAGVSNNPDIVNMLSNLTKGYNTGQFGLQRADVQGQYGLDRAEMSGENAMARETAKETSAMDRQKERNAAMAAREQQEISAGKFKRGASAGKNLDFDAAKSAYIETEKDMRNLQNAYRDSPDPTAYFKDPQWTEIAKRRNESLAAMKEAAVSGVKKTETPPVPGAQQAPDGNWYVQKDGQFFKVEQ